ncbi:MAG: hypothetical protein RID25_23335 [Cyclobacteriaceae bacterium]
MKNSGEDKKTNKGFKLSEIILPDDKIRAYDFPFHDQSYVEGKVVSVEKEWFEVMCSHCSNGDSNKVGTLLFVPISTELDAVWKGDRIIKLG